MDIKKIVKFWIPIVILSLGILGSACKKKCSCPVGMEELKDEKGNCFCKEIVTVNHTDTLFLTQEPEPKLDKDTMMLSYGLADVDKLVHDLDTIKNMAESARLAPKQDKRVIVKFTDFNMLIDSNDYADLTEFYSIVSSYADSVLKVVGWNYCPMPDNRTKLPFNIYTGICGGSNTKGGLKRNPNGNGLYVYKSELHQFIGANVDPAALNFVERLDTTKVYLKTVQNLTDQQPLVNHLIQDQDKHTQVIVANNIAISLGHFTLLYQWKAIENTAPAGSLGIVCDGKIVPSSSGMMLTFAEYKKWGFRLGMGSHKWQISSDELNLFLNEGYQASMFDIITPSKDLILSINTSNDFSNAIDTINTLIGQGGYTFTVRLMSSNIGITNSLVPKLSQLRTWTQNPMSGVGIDGTGKFVAGGDSVNISMSLLTDMYNSGVIASANGKYWFVNNTGVAGYLNQIPNALTARTDYIESTYIPYISNVIPNEIVLNNRFNVRDIPNSYYTATVPAKIYISTTTAMGEPGGYHGVCGVTSEFLNEYSNTKVPNANAKFVLTGQSAITLTSYNSSTSYHSAAGWGVDTLSAGVGKNNSLIHFMNSQYLAGNLKAQMSVQRNYTLDVSTTNSSYMRNGQVLFPLDSMLSIVNAASIAGSYRLIVPGNVMMIVPQINMASITSNPNNFLGQRKITLSVAGLFSSADSLSVGEQTYSWNAPVFNPIMQKRKSYGVLNNDRNSTILAGMPRKEKEPNTFPAVANL